MLSYCYRLKPAYEALLVVHEQLSRRYASTKWTRTFEAATSRMSNNYSVPKEVGGKEIASSRVGVNLKQEPESSKYYVRHNYIPMTRKSLAKRIMEEETLISPEDRERLHEFAVALDHSVGRLYHGVLGELKVRISVYF